MNDEIDWAHELELAARIGAETVHLKPTDSCMHRSDEDAFVASLPTRYQAAARRGDWRSVAIALEKDRAATYDAARAHNGSLMLACDQLRADVARLEVELTREASEADAAVADLRAEIERLTRERDDERRARTETTAAQKREEP